jgi:site-specific DNA-methyltransferase (adenine-specific)
MEPVIQVGGARVFQGDCREVLKTLPDNSVDSIVTDPPYELGFMGKKWDSSGIAYDVTVWAECLRVLKPGGHLLAFGGSRTWHRLAVAVEDAGFEIRDNIAWIYGSGFPKSLDVSKAIDKKAGAEREVVGKGRGITGEATRNHTGIHSDDNYEWPSAKDGTYDITAPSTSEAKAWEGWGTALKPAHEPIVVGRKPLVGTVAENVLAWGVGSLNIDGSRIGSSGGTFKASKPDGKSNGIYGEGINGTVEIGALNSGRWPANVIFDEVTAGLLDEQSGERPGGQFPAKRGNSVNTSFASGQETAGGARGMGDSGGASRFFYVAKASKRDRNEGLEELEAMSAGDMVDSVEGSAGMDSPRAEAGRTSGAKNFHPTVKPTQLMRYLIKLVTPPGGTVLDPFTGSGSTGKAALLDGFQFVGVELTEEYLPIIEGRLKWANEQGVDDERLF